jgi:hypothetical protein
MKIFSISLAVIVVVLATMNLGQVHAQVPTFFEFGVPSSSTMASCPVPPASTPAMTTYCFTGDGKPSYSVNGAPFQLVVVASPVVTAPVTSVNGQTGAVVIPPAPVVSVNGKTGAVVLAATTALQ